MCVHSLRQDLTLVGGALSVQSPQFHSAIILHTLLLVLLRQHTVVKHGAVSLAADVYHSALNQIFIIARWSLQEKKNKQTKKSQCDVTPHITITVVCLLVAFNEAVF